MPKVLDLENQRFGMLVAKKFISRDKKHSVWECRCDCGQKTKVQLNALRTGRTKSCGCLKLAGVPLDITGLKFNKLTVIGFYKTINGASYWNVKCDCGNKKALVRYAITGKRPTKSCGCILMETPPRKTHGLSKTVEYKTWKKMRGRCFNKLDKRYSYYGKRGIVVCKRWELFENFFKDMGPKPSKTHSIDRIDNNGPYSKENCRWATKTEQAGNKRNNIVVKFNGKTKCLAAWARETGISQSLLKYRLRAKWGVERMLTEKPLPGRNQSG